MSKNGKKIVKIIVLIPILCGLVFALFKVKDAYAVKLENDRLAAIEAERLALLNKRQNYTDKGIYYVCLNSSTKIGDYMAYENDVLNIEDGIMHGNAVGEEYIYSDSLMSKYLVSVSDLYGLPDIDIQAKELLPCLVYSEEEATYLDLVLDFKTRIVGYKTRAAVVAAARFIALEFNYHLPYFYENGRLDSSTGRPYADGEGRFYHKGLFLTSSKYSLLDPDGIKSGPGAWGCVILSAYGGYIPNGLDCSGFVSWCLYQGGYDPGDLGGGASRYDGSFSLPDLGVGDGGAIPTDEIDPDTIKAGDLIAWEGTIAIVIGVDEENIYIAHAFWDIDLEVNVVAKDELATSMWHYVTPMDTYYNEAGNGQGDYTDMW